MDKIKDLKIQRVFLLIDFFLNFFAPQEIFDTFLDVENTMLKNFVKRKFLRAGSLVNSYVCRWTLWGTEAVFR